MLPLTMNDDSLMSVVFNVFSHPTVTPPLPYPLPYLDRVAAITYGSSVSRCVRNQTDSQAKQ